MEIYDKIDKGYIEVWLNNLEQLKFDRNKLTEILLKDKNKKYKVIFFLSGKDSLYDCTEKLLIRNLNI